MKRTFMMFAAMTPLIAMAGGTGSDAKLQVDKEKLRSAVPASAMLDEDVYSRNGEEIGELDEILVSRDGQRVQQFVIETDADVAAENTSAREGDNDTYGNEEGWDEIDDETAEAADWTGNATQNIVANEVRVKPDSVSYDSGNDRLTVSVDRLRSKTQSSGEFNAGADAEGIQLSEIIGAEVNLADEDSFGRVEDVMLSKDNSEVVAIVVDNWEGFDKHRRALPLKGAQLSEDDEEVNYSFTAAQVDELPEFNLESHDDDNGWDMADWTD